MSERKRGGQPGNTSSVTHGARSQASVAKAAGYCKQGALQRLRLRQSDLSPTGRYLLDMWARVAAELKLMDAYVDVHGLLDEDGRPPGFVLTQHAARNAASRLWTKLEPHLLEASARKHASSSPLEAHIRANYGKAGT